MRALAAGVFVFGGLLGVVGLLGYLGVADSAPGGVLALIMVPAFLLLIAAALWLFNPKGTNPLGLKSAEEHLRELEAAGLLTSADVLAKRAFAVEEYEDEGLHYFLELVDGRVLFLSGQYLYDFEPVSDDPAVNRPRRFPCSEFTVVRHRIEGYVVDITCRGSILEPEIVAPSFGERVWRDGGIPADGDVITDMSYDALKAALSESTIRSRR